MVQKHLLKNSLWHRTVENLDRAAELGPGQLLFEIVWLVTILLLLLLIATIALPILIIVAVLLLLVKPMLWLAAVAELIVDTVEIQKQKKVKKNYGERWK